MQNILLVFLLLLCPLARAATVVADLGPGLGYLRPSSAAADLPLLAARSPDQELVLDLRRTAFTADETSAWLAALHRPAAGQSVRLVLISPATGPELLAGLATGIPGCLTIGRADGACHPDMAVATDADADARACDALASGTAPSALATETIDKPRHDEVELGKFHAAGRNPPEPADFAAAPPSPAPDVPPPRSPQVDAVLLRAVQIGQGLLALEKAAATEQPQPPSTTKR